MRRSGGEYACSVVAGALPRCVAGALHSSRCHDVTEMMTSLEDFFAAALPGRLVIAGAPEGHDAFVLGGLPARAIVPTLLHVCRDDGRMARLRAALGFFHPGVEVLTLPAWDCLPMTGSRPMPKSSAGASAR